MDGFKKHRGLKRYYNNLATAIDFKKAACNLDFSNPREWHDDWHWHFDWNGYGNHSFKRRKPHLDKLFRHFEYLVDKTKHLKTDFQLYAILLDHTSSSDALFLHSPHPNNCQFYFNIADLQLTNTLTNRRLIEYLDNLSAYEKLYGHADEAFCLLFKKNVGHSFLE